MARCRRRIASALPMAPICSTAKTTTCASALTVSAWARVDAGNLAGWTSCLVCQDDGNDADQSRRIFQISLLNGRIVWHRMTHVEDPVSRGTVIPGTWFHVAAVVDRGV